jgi:hypothetical protein
MQTSYDNIVLNRMKAGTNSRSPKRSTVENHNLLDDGTLICHSWNPCPESNGQFLRTAPTGKVYLAHFQAHDAEE